MQPLLHGGVKKECKFKIVVCELTLIDFLGRRLANFFAAASIEAAAPSNSFSAITVGSSGSTHSLPVEKIMI